MNDPLVGHVLDGRYRVEARIAVGGMATVYRALDTRLDRVLALKVMHPSLAADPGFVERFIREAKAVARLGHANIVNVYDQGTDGTYVFLAMEYVAGCTLRDVLSERGALQPRAALDILEPVLAALGAAHRSGLVHRDMKPENVLIGDDGRVKVADFGLVRAVDTNTSATSGSVLGTVSYLSPEQIEHGTVDTRSDVYACGVLLYEMLTGAKPHAGGTPMQVIYKHLNEDIPAPSAAFPGLAQELDALVARASARDPERRPYDAVELLSQLQGARRSLTDTQLDAKPPAAAEQVTAGAGEPTAVIPRPATASPAAPDDGGQQLNHPNQSNQSNQPNQTARLQLPPEFAQRRAEPAAYPVSPPDTGGPRRGLIVLLGALALVLGVGAAVWLTGVGRYTTVPAVLGNSQAAAEKSLERAGLDAAFTDEFSERIPVGKVISTRPGPGGRVRAGGTVTVVLSKGPERIAVPKVAGKRLGLAREQIRDARLTVGTTTGEFSDEVPRGRVIRTEPGPGRKLRPRAAVALVVSKGEPVDVPDVVGLSVEEARQEIADAGLVAKILPRRVSSDEVPKDSVAQQSPEGDSEAAEGGTVTLTVSRGPQLFKVPDVTNRSEAEARQKLEGAGFAVRVIDVIPLVGDNTVWRQTPAGGSQQPKDATITIWTR